MKSEFTHSLPENWRPAADIFAALGDPMRQKILLLFEPGEELCIKAIAKVFPLSRTAVVHHLNVLERAGVLSSRREGKTALYAPRPEVLLGALDNLRDYIAGVYPGAAKARNEQRR